jgi:hypothetical protein
MGVFETDVEAMKIIIQFKEKVMKNTRLICALFALAIYMSYAHAGIRYTIPAYINNEYKFAYGTMVDTRSSDDTVSSVNCSSNLSKVICNIKDATGRSAVCVSTEPDTVDLVRNAGPESFIFFSWASTSNPICTYVSVQNSSAFRPAAISGY